MHLQKEHTTHMLWFIIYWFLTAGVVFTTFLYCQYGIHDRLTLRDVFLAMLLSLFGFILVPVYGVKVLYEESDRIELLKRKDD